MTAYIALLRGINVSGQKIIKMEELRHYFASFGFENVRTYIQSGNVVFTTKETDTDKLTLSIRKQLETALGYKVSVIIRSIDEMQDVIHNCPFDPDALKPGEKLYITFLNTKPAEENTKNLEAVQNDIDDLKVGRREVYILTRKGYGTSQFSNNFVEKKLSVSATTRNWATVNKLVKMEPV